MIEDNKLVDIAKMYYEQRLTQKEIGDLLGVSRIAISRALSKAIKSGIVEIKINSDIAYKELEEKLMIKYNLQDVKITPTINENEVSKSLAEKISDYIPNLVEKSNIIGIGWGNTLSKVQLSNKANQYPEKTFVSLLGGYGNVSYNWHANQITAKISEAFNSKGLYLFTPALVENPALREDMLKDNNIRKVFEMYKKLDTLIISIGDLSYEDATIYKSGYFTKKDFEEMKKRSVRVDVVSSVFLDNKGEEVRLDVNDRIIGIPPEDIKKTPNVVVVAGGKNKHEAIHLTINKPYIKTLITDLDSAKYLMKR